MRRHHLVTIACSLCLLMFSTVAQAQTVRGGIGIIKKLGKWIDTMTGEDLDSTYVGVPDHPWQFIVQGYANQSDLRMKSVYDVGQMYEGVVGDVTIEPQIRTAITTSAGFWLGYRGWGVGYSTSIGGDKGSDWDFELSSDKYYVKLRLHDFKGGSFKMTQSGYMENFENAAAPPEPFEFVQPLYLSSPVKIKSQLLEGVYIFNSRHFSYTAAYDQSLIQLRSAGSLIAGLRYFHSKYNYAHDSNADLILNMNDIGQLKTWQVSIGAGYAYNWVPVKGLLVSAMVMPLITPYNRIKTYFYDSNYREMALDDVVHSDDELPRENYRISLMDTDSRNSRVQLNVNSRLSVTYGGSRWYVNANGNFYHSRYSYDSQPDSDRTRGKNTGRLNDWSVNANIGIRF